MKRILIVAALSLAAATPVFAADVGVSIKIGEPGFFGQLDIGNYGPPPVVNVQPVIVSPMVVSQPPIYLRVPPEHARHWNRYCRQYHACDKRVFFVQDKWYKQVYAPRYQHDHPHPAHDAGRHDEHRGDSHRDYRNDHRPDPRNDHRNDRNDQRWDQPNQR